jgi:uncharacterized protein YjbI with pentapeptide repeats
MATTAEHEKLTASVIGSTDKLTRKDSREIIESHALWLDSGGELGTRADFSGKNLAYAEMVDARLPDALLHKTNLKAADLTLADLRGAALVQANLAEANLLGTQLQQADLQGANLLGATGLLRAQLAGANLFAAAIPESISPLDGLKLVRETAGKAGWILCLNLFLNALVWLRIFTTPDSHLVKNGSALPFSALQTALPYIPFYLFGPVVLLSLYFCFHLFMQRLWDGIAQLPAIFPDGRRLDASLPWYARWSARGHFHWLRKSQSPLGFLEAAIAIVLLYWVAPLTVLLFWARYMTLEDLRGTTLHILLVVGAVAAAMNFPRMAGKAFGPDSPRFKSAPSSFSSKRVLFLRIVPPAVGLILFLLSIGTFLGVPHDYRSMAQSSAPGFRAWAADVLWTFGYNPFAQLTEAEVSTKPAGWSGRDEQIPEVKGANLNRLRLRYIQAYGVFLVRAHLWRTDLRSSYLSEADLREANLRQVDLRFAILDRANLARAALAETDLRNANLDRADLHDANLSFAMLSEATLLDATLDGANLYKSDMHSALLQRASLKKTDLREANLENTNLTMASLEGAYLVSTSLQNARLKNADLSQAILTDADLRKSDLSGAHLQGAVLRGTNLAGANLQGADLRGAEGLTAAQVCTASSPMEAQMEDNFRLSVAALCGNLR